MSGEHQKACVVCGIVKPLTEFRRGKTYIGGHRPQCKVCTRKVEQARRDARTDADRAAISEYGKAWRERNLERKRATDKANYERNKPRITAQQSEYRKTYDPAKLSAVWKLNGAVRYGKLARAPCVICGNPKSQGHHDNYDRPFDVVWLCRIHHVERHRGLVGDYRQRPWAALPATQRAERSA